MSGEVEGVGKLAEALERTTQELREIARDLVGPAAKEVGQLFADRIRLYRISSTLRAAQEAKRQIAASGITQKPVSLKVLVPALEGASLEEDEDLISRWAGLIASAATTGETIPAFADILRQLTPEEARMLDFIYQRAIPMPVIDSARGVERKGLQETCEVYGENYLVRIQNLDRLGLVVRISTEGFNTMGGQGWDNAVHIGLTALGEAFVRACRGPGKAMPERGQE